MKIRTVAPALLLAAALASCSSGSSLRTLDLSSAGSTRDAAKNEAAADAPLAIGADIEYVAGVDDWGDAAAAHDKKWPAWSFTAPSGDAEVRPEFAKVATALGLRGTPSLDPVSKTWRLADEKTGLMFEGNGYSGTLWWTVYDTSMRRESDAATKDCPPNAACAAPDTVVTPTTIPAGRLFGRGPAEARANEMLAAMGIDTSPGSLGITVNQDEFGTYVTAVHVFRGAPTGMTWSFVFGAGGALMSASGPVFAVVPADEYPVIDVDAAIKRLNDGLGFAYGVVATKSAVAPERAETHIVKITAASMSLVPWWLRDGGQMLLPAYDFTLDDGSYVSVVAVSDKYVTFAGPTADDVPADNGAGSGSAGNTGGSTTGSQGSGAVEPAPPATVAPVTTAQAGTLIGLTLAEAQKVCDGKGWTIRVASMEGKENMLTTDWKPNRVNVDILGGVVTAVSIG